MDDRNPSPSSEIVTRVMRANKAKGTEPEVVVRRMLREMGHPGYRLNWKKATLRFLVFTLLSTTFLSHP